MLTETGLVHKRTEDSIAWKSPPALQPMPAPVEGTSLTAARLSSRSLSSNPTASMTDIPAHAIDANAACTSSTADDVTEGNRHEGAASDNRKEYFDYNHGKAPLLITNVEMGDGRVEQIQVREGEKPEQAAQHFCERFGLGKSILIPLSRHLRENLDKTIQQRRRAQSKLSEGPKSNKAQNRLYQQALAKKKRQELREMQRDIEAMREHEHYKKCLSWISREMMAGRTAEGYQNYGDMLYTLAKSKMAAREQEAAQRELERELDEMQGVTFNPAIRRNYPNAPPHMLQPGAPDWDRLSRDKISKDVHALMERQRQEREQQSLKECTFKPIINPYSAQIVAEKQPQDVPAYEKLFQDSVRRQRAQQENSTKLPDGITFSPKTNKSLSLSGTVRSKGSSSIHRPYTPLQEEVDQSKLSPRQVSKLVELLTQHDSADDAQLIHIHTDDLGSTNTDLTSTTDLASPVPINDEQSFLASVNSSMVHRSSNLTGRRSLQVDRLTSDATISGSESMSPRSRAGSTRTVDTGQLVTRLYAAKQRTESKLKAARQMVEHGIDPFTGEKLHVPNTGRPPAFERNSLGQSIGEYLYSKRNEVKQKQEARLMAEQAAIGHAATDQSRQVSSKLIFQMKVKRFAQLFQHLDTPELGVLNLCDVIDSLTDTSSPASQLSKEIQRDLLLALQFLQAQQQLQNGRDKDGAAAGHHANEVPGAVPTPKAHAVGSHDAARSESGGASRMSAKAAEKPRLAGKKPGRVVDSADACLVDAAEAAAVDVRLPQPPTAWNRQEASSASVSNTSGGTWAQGKHGQAGQGNTQPAKLEDIFDQIFNDRDERHLGGGTESEAESEDHPPQSNPSEQESPVAKMPPSLRKINTEPRSKSLLAESSIKPANLLDAGAASRQHSSPGASSPTKPVLGSRQAALASLKRTKVPHLASASTALTALESMNSLASDTKSLPPGLASPKCASAIQQVLEDVNTWMENSTLDDVPDPTSLDFEQFFRIMDIASSADRIPRQYLAPSKAKQLPQDTFTPQINKLSASMARQKGDTAVPVHERLLQRGSSTQERLNQKRKDKEEEELEGCTFSPKLTAKKQHCKHGMVWRMLQSGTPVWDFFYSVRRPSSAPAAGKDGSECSDTSHTEAQKLTRDRVLSKRKTHASASFSGDGVTDPDSDNPVTPPTKPKSKSLPASSVLNKMKIAQQSMPDVKKLDNSSFRPARADFSVRSYTRPARTLNSYSSLEPRNAAMWASESFINLSGTANVSDTEPAGSEACEGRTGAALHAVAACEDRDSPAKDGGVTREDLQSLQALAALLDGDVVQADARSAVTGATAAISGVMQGAGAVDGEQVQEPQTANLLALAAEDLDPSILDPGTSFGAKEKESLLIQAGDKDSEQVLLASLEALGVNVEDMSAEELHLLMQHYSNLKLADESDATQEQCIDSIQQLLESLLPMGLGTNKAPQEPAIWSDV